MDQQTRNTEKYYQRRLKMVLQQTGDHQGGDQGAEADQEQDGGISVKNIIYLSCYGVRII